MTSPGEQLVSSHPTRFTGRRSSLIRDGYRAGRRWLAHKSVLPSDLPRVRAPPFQSWSMQTLRDLSLEDSQWNLQTGAFPIKFGIGRKQTSPVEMKTKCLQCFPHGRHCVGSPTLHAEQLGWGGITPLHLEQHSMRCPAL